MDKVFFLLHQDIIFLNLNDIIEIAKRFQKRIEIYATSRQIFTNYWKSKL